MGFARRSRTTPDAHVALAFRDLEVVPMSRAVLRSMPFALVVAFALPLTGPAPAGAEEGFRCASGRLVSVGDHLVDVRNKCGDPDYVGQRVEKRKLREKVRRQGEAGYSDEVMEEREVEILLDEWIYDLGPKKFMRTALFENGRVVQTGTGEYGKRR
jgi:Protein of unknown function (DUF2845)